jgi:hypothetical protein
LVSHGDPRAAFFAERTYGTPGAVLLALSWTGSAGENIDVVKGKLIKSIRKSYETYQGVQIVIEKNKTHRIK